MSAQIAPEKSTSKLAPPCEEPAECRPASPATQAVLLRGRGDLQSSKLCWKADFGDTSAMHLPRLPIDRLGFRVKRGAASRDMSVGGVADGYLGRDTPISAYNQRQERTRQSMFKVRPGDRIRAVNSSEAYDEMLRELRSASVQEREFSLSLERELDDILQVPAAGPSSSPLSMAAERKMFRSSSDGAITAARRLQELRRGQDGLRQAALSQGSAPASLDLSASISSSSQGSTRAPTPEGEGSAGSRAGSPARIGGKKRAQVRSGKCWLPGATVPIKVDTRSAVQVSASLSLRGIVAS